MSVAQSILDTAHEEIIEACRRAGLDWHRGHAIARSTEERLRRDWGGRWVYVPAPCKAARNRKVIEARQTGESRKAICERFGISRSTYYAIMRNA